MLLRMTRRTSEVSKRKCRQFRAEEEEENLRRIEDIEGRGKELLFSTLVLMLLQRSPLILYLNEHSFPFLPHLAE